MQLPPDTIEKILKDREIYHLSFQQMADALHSQAGLKITSDALKKKLKREGYLQ